MSYPLCSREKGARALGTVGKMATSHTGFSPPSDPNSNSRSRTSPDEENPRIRGGSQGRVAAMSTIVTSKRAQSASQPRPHVTHPDTTSPSTDEGFHQYQTLQAKLHRARVLYRLLQVRHRRRVAAALAHQVRLALGVKVASWVDVVFVAATMMR